MSDARGGHCGPMELHALDWMLIAAANDAVENPQATRRQLAAVARFFEWLHWSNIMGFPKAYWSTEVGRA